MSLFQKNIEPRCVYCIHGRALSENEVLCPKKGVMAGCGTRISSFEFPGRVPKKPKVSPLPDIGIGER